MIVLLEKCNSTHSSQNIRLSQNNIFSSSTFSGYNTYHQVQRSKTLHFSTQFLCVSCRSHNKCYSTKTVFIVMYEMKFTYNEDQFFLFKALLISEVMLTTFSILLTL